MLWWDDVSEIFDILKADAQAVELETEQYKFTTLDVAKEHFGDTPQYDIKIKSSSPYVSLNGNRLNVGSGPASAKIFLEIDQILKKRQRKPAWLYSSYLVVPVIALGLISFALKDAFVQGVLLAVQIPLSLMYMRAVFLGMKRSLVVNARRKDEAKGFFERNRDQLLMYVLTAIIGGLLVFAGGQLKDQYFPPVSATKPG